MGGWRKTGIAVGLALALVGTAGAALGLAAVAQAQAAAPMPGTAAPVGPAPAPLDAGRFRPDDAHRVEPRRMPPWIRAAPAAT